MSAQTIAVPGHFSSITLKQMTVGTSAAVLTALASTDAVKKPENILVQALAGNSDKIYIGDSSVAAGSTGGIELSPGANINLPSNNFAWYAISASANQKLQITYCQGVS